jgi:hypothetical protein
MAAAGLIAVFVAIYFASRPQRELTPTLAAVGDSIVVLAQTLSITTRRDEQFVDFVVVAKRCAVCTALVERLVGQHATPRPGHAIVMMTDTVWPALSALTSPSVSVVVWPHRLERDIGLRATPTLISLDPVSRRVVQVGVGSTVIENRFTARPSRPSTK